MTEPARLLALILLGLQACSPEPEFVYIPADNYVISVEIVAPAEARVGEWVPLSAQRRSGPWKRVRSAEVPPGFVPFGKPPPEFEGEVADNLHWMTDPAGARCSFPNRALTSFGRAARIPPTEKATSSLLRCASPATAGYILVVLPAGCVADWLA